MKSHQLSRLSFPLLFLIYAGQVNGLCSLDYQTTAHCDDLEDVRYMETYHLQSLRAPSSSSILGPGNFRNLTSLQHLDLSGGNIETIESGSLAKLGLLQTLSLAGNRIAHIDVGAFDGLKQVHNLKLGDNDIRQMPPALMSLKELRLLDLSGNPLNCNCASLKLRDALVARGVKISKKSICAEPLSSKTASILKPETKLTCEFEKQDYEMQGDQPITDAAIEGSGEDEEIEVLETTEKELIEDHTEEEEMQVTTENDEETTTAPIITTSEVVPSTTTTETVIQDIVPSYTVAVNDETLAENTEDLPNLASTTEISTELAPTSEEPTESSNDDLDKSAESIEITESAESEKMDLESTSQATTMMADPNEDSISSSTTSSLITTTTEGSGDIEEGSGAEGSGMIVPVPNTEFSEHSEDNEDEEPRTSSTTMKSTTQRSTWWSIGDILSNLNPWAPVQTTPTPTSTEKSAEDDLKEEHFIKVTQESPIEKIVEEPVVPPKVAVPNEGISKQSPRTLELPQDSNVKPVSEDYEDNSAFSIESKKGMGSYIVLAILLVVLILLISIAFYKGDFCRQKRKRSDIERGTEMKDMQKSLLDQNSTRAKIQASNGSTMENVPLMNSLLPDEPKDKQRSYDITPTIATNGNGPLLDINDPIKPPRKLMNPEIEAPLNGLNPPMEDIDGPASGYPLNGTNEIILSGEARDKPPLSPHAQRVKITLQENPDSVPKTPILITRLKGSDELVKAP